MILSRFRGHWLKPAELTGAGQIKSLLPTSLAQPAPALATLPQPAALPAVNPLEDKYGQWIAQHSSFLKGSTVVAGSGLATMKIGNGWPYAWLEPHSQSAVRLAQIATHKPVGLMLTTHTLLSHYLLALGQSKASTNQHHRPAHPLGVANSSYLVGSAVVKLGLTFYQDRAFTPELAERLMICLELAQHHATLAQLIKTGRFWLLADKPNPANLVATPGQPLDQLEGEALQRLGYALELYEKMTSPANTFGLTQVAQAVVRAGNFTTRLVTLTDQLEQALGQTVQIHLKNSDLEVVAANATLITDIEKTLTALLAHHHVKTNTTATNKSSTLSTTK